MHGPQRPPQATKVARKVHLALDEIRMLVLGLNVLLGFHLRCLFQEGFATLEASFRHLDLASTLLLLVALGSLLLPVSYHPLGERGNGNRRIHALANLVVTVALLPLALSIALDLYLTASRIVAWPLALALALGSLALALWAWYGFEYLMRSRRDWKVQMPEEEHTSLVDKVEEVLIESRVVLPGAQALMGFALSAVFQRGFTEQPRDVQMALLVGIVLLTGTMVALLTAPAYHRLVLDGEACEEFHRMAGKLNLVALACLAVALAANLYIVARVVFDSAQAAWLLGIGCLLTLLTLWFGVPLAVRWVSKAGRRPPEPAAFPG